MTEIYEIVMKSKDSEGPITLITVRVEGLERNKAVLHVESLFPEYYIYYVIAGPKFNLGG